MTPSILDEIVQSKRREVAASKARLPIEELEAQANRGAAGPRLPAPRWPGRGRSSSSPRSRRPAPRLRSSGPTSTRSPSPGLIKAHGAACLSVLTDAPYFQGHLSYLARIRASVAIPLLRKDFLIDEYQVVEARMAGADAIVLIAEILDDDALARLARPGQESGGWPPWSSSTTPSNLPRVLASGADLVGVNNRDLHRFVTDLDLTLRLRDQIPREVVLVSESGIRTRARCRAARGRGRLRHPRRRDLDESPPTSAWPSSGCWG